MHATRRALWSTIILPLHLFQAVHSVNCPQRQFLRVLSNLKNPVRLNRIRLCTLGQPLHVHSAHLWPSLLQSHHQQQLPLLSTRKMMQLVFEAGRRSHLQTRTELLRLLTATTLRESRSETLVQQRSRTLSLHHPASRRIVFSRSHPNAPRLETLLEAVTTSGTSLPCHRL